MDKRLLFLLTVTAIVILGMLVAPSSFAYKYVIANLGEFLIIMASAWIGYAVAKQYGFSSGLGRSLLFITAGFIAWGVGALIWMGYNAAGTEIPYPSWADAGYLLLIPLAGYGLFLLLKNVDFSFSGWTIAKVTVLPLIVLIVSYFLFIKGALGEEIDPLTKLLNVIYPVGDVIFLSFALVILSVTYGSFLFRPLSVISIAFIFQAVADFGFSFATSAETYFTGHWTDYAWMLAFCTVGVGMHMLLAAQQPKEVAKKAHAKKA